VFVDLRERKKAGMSKNAINLVQMQASIKEYVLKALDDLESYRIDPGTEMTLSELQMQNHGIEFLQNKIKDAIKLSRHVKLMGKQVDKILESQGIELEKDSFEYKKLCRDMLITALDVIEIEKRRLNGDYSEDLNNVNGIASPVGAVPPISLSDTPVSTPPEDVSSILLEDVIQEYTQQQVKSGRWNARTVENYRPQFNALVQFLGNVPVNAISKDNMRDYKRLLERLPPGFVRSKEYETISGLDSVNLEGKHEETMDVTTLSGYLRRAKALLQFAVDNEYIETTPFISGLVPPKKKQARSQRDSFTDDELKLIFHPDHYLDDRHSKPFKFWLPILGLYTGCRLEELCQLYIKDVLNVNGIWTLNVNNELTDDYKEDKKVKKVTTTRYVPLHPFLVDDLKFPRYVERMKQKGHDRVFYELKKPEENGKTKESGKYGHYPSKWFGGYTTKVGIKAPKGKKVFHSFRHNFTDKLYQQLITDSVIDELTGRAPKTETRGRYSNQLLVETLYNEGILKLDYESQIDFSHLKTSEYVLK